MSELIANQKRAIEALLTTPSVAAAARACGLNARTLWRYMEDSAFKERLRERRDQAIAAVSTGLVAGSSHASETLWEIVLDPDASKAVKARVADTLITQMRKQVELQDLADRVSELERLADDN